jgi:hypothetical protein
VDGSMGTSRAFFKPIPVGKHCLRRYSTVTDSRAADAAIMVFDAKIFIAAIE